MVVVNLSTKRGSRGGSSTKKKNVFNEIIAIALLALFVLQLYIHQKAWLQLVGGDDDASSFGFEPLPRFPACPPIDLEPLKEGLVCIPKCTPASNNTLRGMGLDPNERVNISMPNQGKYSKGAPIAEYGKYRIHFPEERIHLDLTRRLSMEVRFASENPDGPEGSIVEDNHLHSRSITERLLRRIVAKLLRAGVLDPSKSIVNTGSWIGDNALPWALMLESLRPENPGKIIAIDPSEKFVEDMVDLANANGIGNLCAQIGVLSSKVARVAYIGQNTEHIKVHTEDSINAGSWRKKQRFDIRASWLNAITLDSLNLQSNVSLLHLDVEGHEGELLEGSRETIEASRPIIITEGKYIWPEPEDENDKHVLKVLTELRYTSANLINEIVGLHLDARNRIWWPDEKTKDAAMAVIGKELGRKDTVAWVATDLLELDP